MIREMVGKQMISEQTSNMDFSKSNYLSFGLKFYGPFSLIQASLILIRILIHATMTAMILKVGIETVIRTRQTVESIITILRILLNQKAVGSNSTVDSESQKCVLAYSIKGFQTNDFRSDKIARQKKIQYLGVDNAKGILYNIRFVKFINKIQYLSKEITVLQSKSSQIQLKMLNKKPDTIQGFLSPAKLLSASSKNSKFNNNSKAFGSPVYNSNNKKEDSKYNSQNQSYLNTSRDIENPLQHPNEPNFSRLTGENNRFMATQPVGERKYESERNIPFDKDTRTLTGYPVKKTNLSIAQEQENANNRERTLQEINNRKWETQKFRDIDRQSPLYNPKLKNDLTGSFKQTFSLPKSSMSEIVNLKNTNPQMMTVQCYQLIRKLSKVKQSLQYEIMQLQRLLDNTSRYMQNMQQQFQRIKFSILGYTARCLDSAYSQYKQNMVQWQKYQDFERKSLAMVSQMNEYIYNEQQRLSENKKLSYRQLTMTGQQIQKQIDYYRQFGEEIKKIREQCVGMRPTLTEERVKQFQKGLAILCNF